MNTFTYNTNQFATAQDARAHQIEAHREDIAQMRIRAQRTTSTWRRNNLRTWIAQAEETLASLIAYAEADGTLATR